MSEAEIEAYFDTIEEADRAVRHLRGSGVAVERIGRYAADAPRHIEAESKRRRKKWFGGKSEPLEETPDHDLPKGTHAIRVHISEDHADGVSYIFRRLTPRRLHEHIEHRLPETPHEAMPEGSTLAEHEVIALHRG